MKNKKNVIYLHRYPIEFEVSQFAGLTSLLKEASKKYNVVYLSMKRKGAKDEKLRKMVKIRELPLSVDRTDPFDKWAKTLLYYIMLPRTIYLIKKEKPSFIICKETLPFVPSIIGRMGIPMLIDTSDWWWSIMLGKNKLGGKIARVIERLEVRDWNKLQAVAIAHTKAEASLVNKRGMDYKKIKIINVPLYKGVYHPYNASKERKKLGLKKDDWTVAVHGIIHPSKGYDQLLLWWKKLTEVHPNWKLLIMGGSGGEKWCKNMIKQLGIERNVIMTGWLPTQRDVNSYLNAADALLVTRRNTEENSGVIPSSLFHNLAVGKPTVATGLPGISEIIEHGKSGYLYVPDNYRSFKTILENIEGNEKEAKKVGRAGIKRGEKCFDPDNAAVDYVKVIDESIR